MALMCSYAHLRWGCLAYEEVLEGKGVEGIAIHCHTHNASQQVRPGQVTAGEWVAVMGLRVERNALGPHGVGNEDDMTVEA